VDLLGHISTVPSNVSHVLSFVDYGVIFSYSNMSNDPILSLIVIYYSHKREVAVILGYVH